MVTEAAASLRLENVLTPVSRAKVTLATSTGELVGFSNLDVTTTSERLDAALSTQHPGVLRIDYAGHVTEPHDPRDRGCVLVPLRMVTSVTIVSVNETAAVLIKGLGEPKVDRELLEG